MGNATTIGRTRSPSLPFLNPASLLSLSLSLSLCLAAAFHPCLCALCLTWRRREEASYCCRRVCPSWPLLVWTRVRFPETADSNLLTCRAHRQTPPSVQFVCLPLLEKSACSLHSLAPHPPHPAAAAAAPALVGCLFLGPPLPLPGRRKQEGSASGEPQRERKERKTSVCLSVYLSVDPPPTH